MAIVTVTYLQMLSPNEIVPRSCSDARFQIREATVKQWQFNRFLYGLVGGPWRWIDKLNWGDHEWREYAESDHLRTFPAYHDGAPAGYFELRSDDQKQVEIAYFGLSPKFLGRGFGGVLLTHALRAAWETRPERVWVHTCSQDHPAALPNYQARGMKVYKTEHVPLD